MPELPEVETIKEALKNSIIDAQITSIIVRNRKFRESIPDDFENIFSNTKIIKIWRFAKYAILDTDNGYSIIWHFGMSGKVRFLENHDTPLEKHDHVIFYTSKGIIAYNDARRFGLMTYTKTSQIFTHHLFNNMGIDPFDKNFSATYLLNKLKNKKTPIKTALLDQRIINGIGNIYASEALYKAQISPIRECCSLSKVELSYLVDAIREVLNNAIKAGGSTLRDYRKPDGSTGYFQNQHCVYNKTGQRCPNCTCDIKITGGITKINQAGRSTFYCKTLQK